MDKEELKKALEALEIADAKLFESRECSGRLYVEVSDYMGIAIEILLGIVGDVTISTQPDDEH